MISSITKVLGKAFFATVLIGSIASNVLLLTSQAFHSRAYDLVSRLGYEHALSRGVFAQHLNVQRDKAFAGKLATAKGISNRIARRVLKNVSYNVSSVLGEAVPYIGAATVVAVTALDIKDGCDTVRDLNALVRSLDPTATPEPEEPICGMVAPSLD